MYSEDVKKSFFLSTDLILSVVFSFITVIAFAFVLHAVDMRLQGKDVTYPFVEQLKKVYSTFLATSTISEATLSSNLETHV